MSEDSLSEQQQLLAKLAELEQLMTKVYIHDTRFQLVNAELQATKVDLRNYVKDYFDNLLVGSVSAFAMTTPPEGWLECNGQEISRTSYARLFQRISTTFGIGDGSTTFNLPNLTGVFIRGWDAAGKYVPYRKFGSYQADQMQSHTHKDSGHSHSGSTSSDGDHDHSDKVDSARIRGRFSLFSHNPSTKSGDTSSGYTSTNGSHNHSGKSDTDGSHSHVCDHNDNGDTHKKGNILRGETKIGHLQELRTDSAGFHDHQLYIDSAGSHFHEVYINSAGVHSHTVSTETNSASLGNPVSSGYGDVRHGNETSPKNVALMYCIKY